VKEYLEIGVITSPHGVRGEMKVECWGDSPEQDLALTRVYRDDRGTQEFRILSSRAHAGQLLLTIEGIGTPEEVRALRGTVLYARREDMPLPEGTYFLEDLMGLSVVDEQNGTVYGTVEEILTNGPNDVYVVRTAGGKVYMPAIREVIRKLDPENGRIEIFAMPGLFDDGAVIVPGEGKGE